MVDICSLLDLTNFLFSAPSNAGLLFKTGFLPFGISGFNLTWLAVEELSLGNCVVSVLGLF